MTTRPHDHPLLTSPAGRWLRIVFVAVLCAWVVRAFVAESIYNASASMEKTLPAGTHAVLDKISLRLRSPRRGDIVVFPSPLGETKDMIKRVIGVEGDAVELRAKNVYINGRILSEPYARHSRADERLEGDDLGPMVVPEDCLFVLGDNRDVSNDSSVWRDPKTGERIYFVKISSVKGILRGFFH
ncbi:MAG: signal peptidase I [Elusimicrobia bacterium RIFCSPLOWO2_12_FULL_59_9]|nr:MAG: signal peptidase I [Elusimicrobia bacterium RIFCSPLOWO2_12_FULL_59_9]